jgi:phage tail sheath protein FI
MPTYKRPGAYITESLLTQTVLSQSENQAIGCLVGPLNKGPVVPTLVRTWSEYQRVFGTYTSTDYMGFAAYMYFANGGRPLYVVRVPGTSASAASVALKDRSGAPIISASAFTAKAVSGGTATITATNTFAVGEVITQSGFTGADATTTGGMPAGGLNGTFTITAASGTSYSFALTGTVSSAAPIGTPVATTVRPPTTLTVSANSVGAWGSNLSVTITDNIGGAGFDVSVTYNGVLVETFLNLQMTSTVDRYAPTVINQTSAYIAAIDGGSSATGATDWPIAGTYSLVGGSDGTAATDYTAAVATLDVVNGPLVINLPGNSTAGQVNTAITYASGRGDCFVVADTASGVTPTAATTYASGLNSSAYAAVYYPWVAIPDPLSSVSGTVRYLPPGGAVMGRYLSTDSQIGVWKAPAGIDTTINGAVATERILTASDLDSLNSSSDPINAIRQIPGAGICIMGARTLNQSASDRYVNIRRTLIYLKRELNDRVQFALFRNNDADLWDDLRSSLDNFLTQVWQQGGLAGAAATDAFYVRCDATNNTSASIANGELRVEVGVSLEYPAEFVVITIGQILGSTTVTEA